MKTSRVVALGAGALAAAVAAWLLLRPSARPPEVDWALDFASVAAPATSVSGSVRELVDRVGSDDAMEASKAWLDLGSRYQSAHAFLADVGPALFDARPIRFDLVRTHFSGGGHTFEYFTPKTPGASGGPAFAHSVGQALCHHLWQYEDVSHTRFRGNFRDWWASYARKHRLPIPASAS